MGIKNNEKIYINTTQAMEACFHLTKSLEKLPDFTENSAE